MSANDWLSCPICKGLPENLRDGVEQFYGKVDSKEYEVLKKEYTVKSKSNPVRVDYEYALHADGTISLGLWAQCNNCNAEWKHQGVVR
jgi:hypothetical protein